MLANLKTLDFGWVVLKVWELQSLKTNWIMLNNEELKTENILPPVQEDLFKNIEEHICRVCSVTFTKENWIADEICLTCYEKEYGGN